MTPFTSQALEEFDNIDFEFEVDMRKYGGQIENWTDWDKIKSFLQSKLEEAVRGGEKEDKHRVTSSRSCSKQPKPQ